MLFKCNWNVEQAADEYWGSERYLRSYYTAPLA